MFKSVVMILWVLPCLLCAFDASTQTQGFSHFRHKLDLQRSGEAQKYLQTQEDMKRLGFFSAMYDMAAQRESPAGEIPKTLHFIWLGPKSFPETSIAHVKGWIDRHPGWKVVFWTDLSRNVPDDRMQVRSFDQFPLEELKDLYFRSDNFGERSELLRYAILLNEGGVYVDHDVVNIQPIDPLQKEHDFFCGMELLGRTVLSSSVNPSPHLIASTPQHPILKATKNWVIAHWDRLEAQYIGSSSSAIFNRVQHRTFRALSVGIKEAYARSGRKDVVFPPDYFSLNSPKEALFAVHQHVGSWYKEDPGLEPVFSQIKKSLDKTYLLFLILALLNCAFGILLVVTILRKKKKVYA